MPENYPDSPVLSEASAALLEYDCSLQLEEWKIPFSFPFLISALLLAEMEFIFFRAAQKVLLFWFVLKTVLITQSWELQLLPSCPAFLCSSPSLCLPKEQDPGGPVPGKGHRWHRSSWAHGICVAKPLLGVLRPCSLGSGCTSLSQGNPLFCFACVCRFCFTG